jgi:phospholipid transport system substrate-binding protein
MRDIHFCSAAVLCSLLAASTTNAGEPTDLVKSVIERVDHLLTDPKLQTKDKEKEREDRVRDSEMALMDVDEMAKRALGTHWGRRTAAEQKEFVGLFRGILERIATPDPPTREPPAKIAFDRETIEQGFAQVEGRVITSARKDIPFIYRLHLVNGKWRLYDWVVRGVSLIDSYRVQFNRIMANSSFEGVIKLLREKKEIIDKRRASEK